MSENHPSGPARGASPLEDLLANALAYADYPPRGPVHAVRNAAAPLPRSSFDLFSRKCIQAMNGDDVRHTEFCRNEHGPMAARQGAMCVNQVDLQFAAERGDFARALMQRAHLSRQKKRMSRAAEAAQRGRAPQP